MSIYAFVEKNWLLILAFVVSGAMLVWPLISRRWSGTHEIGTLGATQLINTKNPLVLDVRETKEFNGGKVPNAMHVPLSQLASRSADLAKYTSRPVIAYCDRGMRARASSSILAKAGFKDIYHLAGGFKAWKDAGLPVQKT